MNFYKPIRDSFWALIESLRIGKWRWVRPSKGTKWNP